MTKFLAAGLVILGGYPAEAQLALPGLNGTTSDAFGGPAVRVTAQFTAPTPDAPAQLFVTADILESFHIYSLGQPPGGPQKTVISLAPSDQYDRTGPFQASPPPTTHIDTQAWVGLEIQEHHGRITWYAPIAFQPGVDPATLSISGRVDTQACDPGRCIPLRLPFTARLGPGVKIAAAAEHRPAALGPPPLQGPTFIGQYRSDDGVVTIRGHLEPAALAPGGKAFVVLTAEPDPGWHVYALADRDPKEISKPTLIVVDPPAGMRAFRAATTAPVVEDNQEDVGLGIQRYYRGRVTWKVAVEVPSATPAGAYTLSGIIAYQTCQASACRAPTALRFQTTLRVRSGAAAADNAPLTFAKAEYEDAARIAQERPLPTGDSADAGAFELEDVDTAHQPSLVTMLLFGFLGGWILNLMPCVLPVIGLKLLSFVEQAGKSRAHALMLNVWYSLGILLVFLLLAALAVGAGMTWGEQFGNDAFNITLAAVVFAMGLSLLGVWEMPIPGFVGGSRAMDLSEQEGPGGALIKGVLTTVLATPCTGPFMGTALGWLLRQPAATTFAVFASMGLGMASPYLLIGAYPGLIRWLPKPGAWMVTFKQLMGFVLLGTVIFLLTFIHPYLVVPTLALLAGIGAACWWIARTPGTAALEKRLLAWAGGVVFVAMVGFFAFGWFAGVMAHRFNKVAHSGQQVAVAVSDAELRWEPFTNEKFERLTRAQQTVLVDFTADWCATCKTLERLVLNTREVKDVVERNRVVTLVADYTRRPANIKQMLSRLKSNGVPVVAIFPAGRAHRPIVFRGVYTQAALVEAMEEAGPSRDSARAAPVARQSPPRPDAR